MKKFSIVIHGGAGVILREKLTDQMEKDYRAKLKESVLMGYNILKNNGADNNIRAVIVHAIIKTIDQSSIFDGLELTKSISVAIVDGPAIKGIAKGTIKGSPSKLVPITPCLEGNTILIPIINRMIPPAILTDSLSRCKIFKRL